MIETGPSSGNWSQLSFSSLPPVGPREPGSWVSGGPRAQYLAHAVVFEEGQEADVAARGDAFEERDVPVPGIELNHVVEDIGHGFPGQEQIDKFLLMRERGKACQGEMGNKRKRAEKEGRKQGGRETEIRGAVASAFPQPSGEPPTLLSHVTLGTHQSLLHKHSLGANCAQDPVCGLAGGGVRVPLEGKSGS